MPNMLAVDQVLGSVTQLLVCLTCAYLYSLISLTQLLHLGTLVLSPGPPGHWLKLEPLQILFAVGYIAFRVAHDPLRKYPGPLIARFSSAYGAFYVWRQCLHLVAPKLHEKYG